MLQFRQLRLLIDLLDMNSCPQKKQFMTTAKLKECFDIIMLQKAKHLKKQEVQSILIILLFCFLCHPRRIHKLTNSFQFLKWLAGKKIVK